MDNYWIVNKTDVDTVASFFEGDRLREFVFLDYIHARGFRLGQAFFMSLDSKSQKRLSGSTFDPFHKNDLHSVLEAIDFLTR